ncbi:hypothetical protein SAMN05421639_104172 [Chryseobacterium shigense]|uniref:Uncharacterized protein n=1 Tax=Chryseobacterium shigense TaxID=297244 RepID=A0A1N7ILB9_9FLAO|nr:hypothetical protein [Chryseobacterium shigense]SIS37852.1 hypothetical protein SAMN05421639_104172 [Chryseobacterium shigense]
MKKIFTIISLTLLFYAYYQHSMMAIDNYATAFDFQGTLGAYNFAGECYPNVSSGTTVIKMQSVQ